MEAKKVKNWMIKVSPEVNEKKDKINLYGFKKDSIQGYGFLNNLLKLYYVGKWYKSSKKLWEYFQNEYPEVKAFIEQGIKLSYDGNRNIITLSDTEKKTNAD